MRALTTQIGGVCAAIFAILFAIGIFLLSDSPDSDGPNEDYTKYVNDSGNLVENIIGAYIVVIAALVFLIFLAAIYRRLRSAEGEDGLWSLVVLVSGTIFVAMAMAGTILIVAIAGAIKFGSTPEPPPEFARYLPQAGFGLLLLAGGLAAALMTAVISGLIVQTRTLPVWVGYTGFLAALAMVFAVIFVPAILFVLWMLALGIAMMMTSEPQRASAAA
jgi:uncharacterized membrane protein YhaH (DUF805 family)